MAKKEKKENKKEKQLNWTKEERRKENDVGANATLQN